MKPAPTASRCAANCWSTPPRELPAIAEAVRETGLRVVYSSADYLWAADGALDMAALERALDAAETLGAPRLKMAIGGFGAIVARDA